MVALGLGPGFSKIIFDQKNTGGQIKVK